MPIKYREDFLYIRSIYCQDTLFCLDLQPLNLLSFGRIHFREINARKAGTSIYSSKAKKRKRQDRIFIKVNVSKKRSKWIVNLLRTI